MSNFQEAFEGLLEDAPQKRARRISRYATAFGHTRAEATIIDDCVMQGVHAAVAALGAALDALTPVLQATAMPALLDSAATNVSGLNQAVTAIVFGQLTAAPGCACADCKSIGALSAQLNAAEAAANSASNMEFPA